MNKMNITLTFLVAMLVLNTGCEQPTAPDTESPTIEIVSPSIEYFHLQILLMYGE